jgi:N-acetylglutamate synthase-like GNAT family acetyltransferase
MSTLNPQVRRATIEDVPKLVELWSQESLPCDALTKRFHEFQVVEQEGGALLGAIGLQIAGHQGRLHSEVFARPENSDVVRALVWERAQVIAKNHGLVWVWTQFNAPFWRQNGFHAPDSETATKLPGAFTGDPRPWTCLQLREETNTPAAIDREFAIFKEMEHERTERLFRQARIMKLVAVLVVSIVFVLIFFWGFYWLKTQGIRR